MAENEDKKDSGRHDVIIEHLKTLSKSQDNTTTAIVNIDKKLDLHVQKTQYELQAINRLDEQQNVLLDKHIEGVNTLKAIFQQHEKADEEIHRKLGAPGRWLRGSVKVIGGMSALTGLIYIIVNLLEKL